MRLKWVFRRDEIQRHFRIARLMWERGEVGFGNGGYSAELTFALRPSLFSWTPRRDIGFNGFLLTVLGIRIHYERSYGGIYA